MSRGGGEHRNCSAEIKYDYAEKTAYFIILLGGQLSDISVLVTVGHLALP